MVVGTDALTNLSRREQGSGFNNRTLAMHPFGFNGIEPGTLDGQQTQDDPHTFAAQFDEPIVIPNPGAHSFAHMQRMRGL